MPESENIRALFARICKNYDAANRMMSGGIDVLWRKKLAKLVEARAPKTVGDFATGSGDVAFALAARLGDRARVCGYDFCPQMLACAEAKQSALPPERRLAFEEADCMNLSALYARAFDVCTVAFGVRNFPDRARGFRELHACLRAGGSLFMMEFSQPYRWLAPFFRFYLAHVLPALARRAGAKHAADYAYLVQSVRNFPDAKTISAELRAAGFSHVRCWRLTGGIVAIHEAVK